MELDQAIRRYNSDKLTDEQIAAKALADATTLKELKALVTPLVVYRVWTLRRSSTRALERSAAAFNGGMVPGEPDQMIAHMKLLRRSFPIPTGERPIWGEATEEQHQARIDWLEAHVAGTRRTIKKHEEAIAAIRRHGVSCLNEIEAAA